PDSTVINPEYNIDSLINAQLLIPDSTDRVPMYRDTAILSAVTNYATSILEQDAATRANKMVQLLLNKGKYEISIVKAAIDSNQSQLFPLTEYAKSVYARLEPSQTITIPSPANELEPAKLNDTIRGDTAKAESYF